MDRTNDPCGWFGAYAKEPPSSCPLARLTFNSGAARGISVIPGLWAFKTATSAYLLVIS